jgi:sugar phosphate isomerase/epimerase
MTEVVHPRVCVSGISSWNQTIDEDLVMYADLGVHTIGAALRKVIDIEPIVQSGLRVANVIGVGPFQLDDPASWGPQQARVSAAMDVAARLGAPHLVLTTGPAGALEWNAASDAFSAALDPVLSARPSGVQLCLEHTNSLRVDVGFVHTLRDAIDLARRLDVLVCMEVNACWAERDLSATIASGINRIGVVQVSDFAVGTHSTPNRLVPGDGDIPLRRIIDQLLTAGYEGVFDVELVGPKIEEEGYRSAIARSVRYVSALLDER